MNNNGDLIKGFTDAYTVRGDTKGFAGSENSSPMDSGAPVWLEGMSVDANATNSMGAVGDTGSDPMFDKFKHQATGNADQVNQTGSNTAEGVASSSMPSGSDPMFEEMPHDNSVNNA
jgi:hypothetical protein